MLHVQKAPGGIVVQAVSEGHEFNWATMDVSHTVWGLEFGGWGWGVGVGGLGLGGWHTVHHL